MASSYYTGQGFMSKLKQPASVTPTPAPKATPQLTPNRGQVPFMSAKNPKPIPVSKQVNPRPIQQPQPTVQSPQKPKTFMQGNFVSKAFDVISQPYYAFSGMLKGFNEESKRQRQIGEQEIKQGTFDRGEYYKRGIPKILEAGVKNIIPGIQQRTMISDAPGDFNFAGEAGIENKGAQFATNLAGSLAVPSLAITKIPGVRQAGNFMKRFSNPVKNAIERVPGATKVIESTIDPYFRNKKAGNLIREANRTEVVRLSALYNRLNTLRKGLSDEQQRIIGEALDTGKKLKDKKLQSIVNQARQLTLAVGDEAVRVGLMKKETLERMGSTYLSRVWETTNDARGLFRSTNLQTPKFSGKMFKQRKGKEGYITEFAPALLRGLGTEIKDITAKTLYDDLIREVGKKFTRKSKVPQGYTWARDGITNQKMRKFFKGVALPDEVIEYLNRIEKTAEPNKMDQALQIWKAIKTIYNPAYHGRNMISNQFLANMQTGRGMLRTVTDYLRASGNYMGKGDQRYFKAAMNNGLIKNMNFYSGFEDLMKSASLRSQSKLKTIFDSPRKLQQFTEDTAKLNVFRVLINREARKLGRSLDDVLNDKQVVRGVIDKVEEAIFSPYRINAQERQMISRYIPFYSFTRQAVPFTAKTFASRPDNLKSVPRTIEAVENLSRDDAPDPRDVPRSAQNFVRLPIKDEADRNTYLDPTYVLPYGNFDSGQEGQLPFGFSTNPFLAEAYSQLLNKDTFTQRPITKFENINQGSDRIKHLIRTLAPTFPINVINKLLPAFQGKEDASGNRRGRGQAVLDTIFGIKSRNYSNEELKNQADIGKSIDINSFETDMEKIDREEAKGNLTPEQAQRQREKLQAKFDEYINSIR